jgi:hypothetical protein
MSTFIRHNQCLHHPSSTDCQQNLTRLIFCLLSGQMSIVLLHGLWGLHSWLSTKSKAAFVLLQSERFFVH